MRGVIRRRAAGRGRSVLVLLLAGAVSGGCAAPSLVIVNVSVIPMDRERVLPSQTVVVRGSRIERIGPAAEVATPRGARVIDGGGRYLVPGLHDLHAHLPDDTEPGWLDDYLLLQLAHGVTTLRSMRGAPEHAALRDRVVREGLAAPSLHVSGRPLRVKTEADRAAALVQVAADRAAGFDFVKWLAGRDAAAYDDVVRAAAAAHLPISGHAPPGGLSAAIRARQASIEHMEPYLEVRQRDPGGFARLLAEQAAAGVASCPDIYWYLLDLHLVPIEELERDPALAYLPAPLVARWRSSYRDEHAALDLPGKPTADERAAQWRRIQETLASLAAAGVSVLAGAGDGPYVIPGLTLHRELRELAGAGLSSWATLATATRDAARFLHGRAGAGTIVAGERADLLLLDANPLEDIGNTRRVAGVVARGRWWSREELAAALEGMANRRRTLRDAASAPGRTR